MSAIHDQEWGSFHTRPVVLYTLTNSAGSTARVTNFGAILQSLLVPDRNGQLVDVTLGFDTFDEYLGGHPHFGSTVGRCANRIGGGQFTLDGKTYTLATNNGPNHLHGGYRGFDKHLWEVTRAGQGLGDVFVKMEYQSPDEEEGYPGALNAAVTYTLTHDSKLRIEMQATTDAPTVINLSNHAYWNLNGHNSGNILDHTLTLDAEFYTPTDATRIPTGEIAPVVGTALDFTQPRKIGERLSKLPPLSEGDPGGYDHNFVIHDADGTMKPVALASSERSGVTMTVHSNQPGVQFYTGNFLTGSHHGKGGAVYDKHAGFCLETQKYPDAINKTGFEGWPSVILRPGESYYHEVVYGFATNRS